MWLIRSLRKVIIASNVVPTDATKVGFCLAYWSTCFGSLKGAALGIVLPTGTYSACVISDDVVCPDIWCSILIDVTTSEIGSGEHETFRVTIGCLEVVERVADWAPSYFSL